MWIHVTYFQAAAFIREAEAARQARAAELEEGKRLSERALAYAQSRAPKHQQITEAAATESEKVPTHQPEPEPAAAAAAAAAPG